MAQLSIQPLLDAVLEQIDNLLPKQGIKVVENIRQELEHNLRAALEARLARLNLVTREEFEVQRAVLERTQQQLQTMADQVAELEKALNAKL